MSDHAISADGTRGTRIGMDHGIVLDVGSCTHRDGVGIATKDSTKPQGSVCINENITDGCGVGRYECTGVYLWGMLQFLQQFIGGHPFKIA